MKSIWNETTKVFPSEPLTRDITVDAAVIGGGMAGILTAYLLHEQGLDTVVLEANSVGSGQTEATTAKVTAQHGLIYERLIREWGEPAARQYAMANLEAIEAYEDLIQELKIDCDWERRPAYLYTLSDPQALEREWHAARKIGIEAELTDRTALPFCVGKALKFPNQAMFHPLKFLHAVAEQVNVYGETRAEEVEKERIYTGRHVVLAKYMIVATHFPVVNIPGFYFMRMHQDRSYVLALEHAGQLDGMYLGIDPGADWSMRNCGELMLFGGGSHRTGENQVGGKYDLLEKQARSFWPVSRERACWSAQDCMTLDGIPYIGTFSPARPDWYVATGFGKWGMTSSMAAARMIRDAILGQVNLALEIFSPQRCWKAETFRNFFKEGGYAAKGLTKGIFAKKLPEGKDAGTETKKDVQSGKHPRCTHMGCRLEWNADEQIWECPCHGSQFGRDGEVLGEPAQNGGSN